MFSKHLIILIEKFTSKESYKYFIRHHSITCQNTSKLTFPSIAKKIITIQK